MTPSALTRSLAILIFAMISAGCASSTTVRQIEYAPFGTAYEVRNDRGSAIVVPAVGRIMEYSVDGSPNLLFVHQPDVVAYKPDNTIAEPNKWHNYGGDKVWFWPQSQWPRLLGREWPPPHQLDGLPWTAKAVRGGIELTSTVVPQYGYYATRTIRLERDGGLRQEVEIRVNPDVGKPVEPVGAWTVTQVRLPESVVVNAVGLKDVMGLQGRALQAVEERGQTRLIVRPGSNGKVSGAGTSLQAYYAGGVFTQSLVRTSEGSGDPKDRAQVYASEVGPELPAGEQIVELEFASPLAVPTAETPVRLEVRWAFAPSAPK